MPAIEKIGIISKKNVAEAKKMAEDVAAYLIKKKRKVFLAEEATPEFISKCQLMVVLGGDGTLLGVARQMIKKSIPIMGINMGQLGFLTEIKKTEVYESLDKALRGRLPLSTRSMLECRLMRKGREILSMPVVNDVVVSKGAIARIFDMQVMADDLLVSNIKADGLIVSTPTGSTAYNLAAGGPIISPDLDAVAITPICAHSLTLRPIILPDTAHITMIPHHRNDSVVLTLDGQSSVELKSGDQIHITKFKKHSLQILRSPERDYFSLLREKLKYGYRD